MNMKRALAVVLAAGFIVSSYATDARVVVMGRHNAFIRDATTVFRNPADISIYPDMLYGSLGALYDDRQASGQQMITAYPQDPFFGGMLSYRFSEEENGPMLSFGAFFNRRDVALNTLMSEGGIDTIVGDNWGKPLLKEPVAKIDLIVGYDMGNGVAFGIGAYGAHQRYKNNGDHVTDETSIYKGTVGVNWNIEQGLDLEASVNAGRLTGIYFDGSTASTTTISEAEWFYRGDVRFFSAVPAINGAFVPQVSLEFMNLKDKRVMDLAGGVGVNMNIDRGFFWAGVQGVYTNDEYTRGSTGDNETTIGARLSFGIERNVLTDWFLIRVGGMKEVRLSTKESATGNQPKARWIENESGNNTDGDLVGLGFGLNIDNRLRIDFVATEDLPYTFTNLISGNKPHIFNRVSATYRF